MKTAQMQAALEAAIAKHANAEFPGAWKVEAGDGYVMLVWSCDEDEAPEMYGDEPWTIAGGTAIMDEMISSASLWQCDDSGCDKYVDSHGDQVISQWVQWNVSDDDE